MLTNELNLPAPLVEAIRNDPYEKGDCQFSATELIAPPYMRTLMRNHADAIEVDASDRVWSLLGQSVHGILERSKLPPGWIVERRYIGEFYPQERLKVRVGAKIDVYDANTGTLDDYKVTSVYKFKTGLNGYREIPSEYEAQINIQAECIYRETGYEVKRGRIIGILRDWRRSERMREEGYPPHQVAAMEIPIWPHEKREAYILERIRLHMAPEPTVCSVEERWERPAKWALMKKGQKRAVRLYDSKEEAIGTWMRMLPHDAYSVDGRPGCRLRCESYCEVAAMCPNYQAYLVEKSSSEAI